jgi:hypothetical protein
VVRGEWRARKRGEGRWKAEKRGADGGSAGRVPEAVARRPEGWTLLSVLMSIRTKSVICSNCKKNIE